MSETAFHSKSFHPNPSYSGSRKWSDLYQRAHLAEEKTEAYYSATNPHPESDSTVRLRLAVVKLLEYRRYLWNQGLQALARANLYPSHRVWN